MHNSEKVYFYTKIKNEHIELLLVNVKDSENNEALETFLVAQLVYILKNNEFSPENRKTIIKTVKNNNNMSTYDYLMKEAKNEGIEIGREEGLTIKEQQKNKDFATSLIISTDFDDGKIATLVGVSAQFVLDLRDVLKK